MKNIKQELTYEQLKHLKRKILKHFNDNVRFDRFDKIIPKGTFQQLDNNLGLAYTSSSAFAMLSICNTEVYLDAAKKYTYECFGCDELGYAFALCKNVKDESELYIYI